MFLSERLTNDKRKTEGRSVVNMYINVVKTLIMQNTGTCIIYRSK